MFQKTTLFKLTFKWLWRLFLFAILTLLTQIGGVIYLLSLPVAAFFRRRFRLPFIGFGIFIVLYSIATIWIVPQFARKYNRVPLSVFSNPHLKPENIFFAFLNRHYVRRELKTALENAAEKMQKKFPGTVVYYMDANFPLIDGYPLEPHFSHRDGRKVDIGLFWTDSKTGKPTRGLPSPFGYGVCAEPLPGESDYAKLCENKGFWYISLDKTIAEPFFDKKRYAFDAERTRELGVLLAEDPTIGIILIQPHLEIRLGLTKYDNFRTQQCAAARHDDHYHVQLKK